MAPHRTAPAAPTAREIELHSPWMRRLALALVGSADAADDVVQDAWARLAGAPTERGTHVGFLVGLVRSLAHGRRRGEARRRVREASVARREALPSTAEVAARFEVARRMVEALEQLDEPYRTTLVLRFYDELSAAEIARRADISAGTVRARLKRGLDLLRARLDDGEGGRASWLSALTPLLPTSPRSSAVGAATMTTFAASALLTMKLTLGATLCALAALLAWTFVGRESTHGRALDVGVGDEAALIVSELVDGADGAQRRATALDGAQPDVALDARFDDAAPRDSRVTIIARATARDGRPLQGAWLRVDLAEQHEARSELDGRLELPVERAELERLARVSSGRYLTFHVGAPGFRTLTLSTQLDPVRESVVLGDVILRPGGAVHGRVLDPAGLGVENALIVFGAPLGTARDAAQHTRLGPPDLPPVFWSGEACALTTHSGPGGSFRIDGVPVGYGVAWARTATSLWVSSDPVGVRAGEDVGGIELVVTDGHGDVIAGRVLDPDGRAEPGVQVWIQRPGSQGGTIARTDADGRFHFASSDGHAHSLTVRSPSVEWGDIERIDVATGTHDLELRFERGPFLVLQVQDEHGRAIADGRVVGVPARGVTRLPIQRCEAQLDSTGHARLIDPGTALRVRIEAPGYRDTLVGPYEPRAFPAPLVVTMTPVPALVGQVQLPDGQPARGARVSLHMSATGPGSEATAQASTLTHQTWSGDRDAFVYTLHAVPTAEVRADADGRFRLPLPGFDARAADEPYAPTDFNIGALELRGSNSRRLAQVDPRQPWFVHAATEGHATVTCGPHVFDPAREVSLDMQLPPSGSIDGRLILNGGESAHGWTVHASDGLAEVVHTVVGEDGTFRFERLHAGPWQVRVFEPGERFSARAETRTERMPIADVQVVAGETVEYEHRAEAYESAWLTGRLTIDRASPGDFVVTNHSLTRRGTRRAAVDPDGRFEIEVFPGQESALWITGTHRGAPVAVVADIEVAPGDNELSFDFETARLEVRVDPTGIPASPGLRAVYVAERGPVTVRVTFEPSEPGHYGPFFVPAGRGRLDAPTDDYRATASVWAELDLAPGELRVLDLR
jgi:RNA polymerase sigma-70 factor (ECF subfamily)